MSKSLMCCFFDSRCIFCKSTGIYWHSLSVRPSVPLSRPKSLRRVCCCGPGWQEISIDCCMAHSRGVRRANATLSAYVDSWTQASLTFDLFKCISIIAINLYKLLNVLNKGKNLLTPHLYLFAVYLEVFLPRCTSYGPVSAYLSVCHKSKFYRSSWTKQVGFWHGSFIRFVLHCILRKFG